MLRKNNFLIMCCLLIPICFASLFLGKFSLYGEIPLDCLSNQVNENQELQGLDSSIKTHKNSHDLSKKHKERTCHCRGPTGSAGPAGAAGPPGIPGPPGSLPLLGYANFYSQSAQTVITEVNFEITGVNNGAIIPTLTPGIFQVATGFRGDYFIQFSLNFLPSPISLASFMFALKRLSPSALIYPNSNITFTIGQTGIVLTYGFFATLNEGDTLSLVNNTASPAAISPVNTGNISAAILFEQLN